MYSRILCLTLLLLIVAAPAGWAVEHQYATANIVAVQRTTRTRVALDLVIPRIGTEIPYFVMTVQLGQTQYITEFTPRHDDEELPADWVAGADVSVRLEKHAMFLKQHDGSESRWIVTKKHLVKEKDKEKQD